MSDPFGELGLDATATADEVRRARRALAKNAHPDAGGDERTMQRVNAAAASALRTIADHSRRSEGKNSSVRDSEPSTPTAPRPGADWDGEKRDAPSFTVEALPAETFEALLLVAEHLGAVADDDPPYSLTVLLDAPIAAWCDLRIVPDAGASTVSIEVAATEGSDAPSIVNVRNAWVEGLNRLDWSRL